MSKRPSFYDIPQRIQGGGWECNYGMDSLPVLIAEWQAEKNPLLLYPDFQRGHVWTEAQQIAFIEYVLTGGRSGLVLYFNSPNWPGPPTGRYKEFTVVDGLQRLTAMLRFVGNEIRAFGHLRSEYEGSLRMHQTIKINVNSLATRAEVLTWYLQINAGGTPHTEAELDRVRALLAKEGGSQ